MEGPTESYGCYRTGAQGKREMEIRRYLDTSVLRGSTECKEAKGRAAMCSTQQLWAPAPWVVPMPEDSYSCNYK